MEKFILSCGSTADIPYSTLAGRDVNVIFYTYMIDGEEFVDDMGRDPKALSEFYAKLSAGALPTTSQISIGNYMNYFRELLVKGDVLHLEFSSGMSGSVHNAVTAAAMLREQFPDRRITVIDTTSGSAGYGILVLSAADLRDRGFSLEETAQWVRDSSRCVHHQFFSTDLTHFKRSGRVSGLSAAFGTILGICPLMHLDIDGRITAYSKVRGRKKALEATADWMEQHAIGGRNYDNYCFISHSECAEAAEELRNELERRFPKLAGRIEINPIGTIIGSHSGPGTVALYFFGDERPAAADSVNQPAAQMQ